MAAGPSASLSHEAQRAGKLEQAGRAQAQAADPRASVWVSASAGTGKTKVLTDRVLALLLAGADPARLLCLTFTRAAAAEMQTRLARRLTAWVALPELQLRSEVQALTGVSPGADDLAKVRALFARVLEVPGGMKIQTIHSFCQSLIARFPIEAEIAPHFELMDEMTARETMADAKAQVLARAADDGGPLGQALATVGAWVNEEDFDKLLRELLGRRAQLAGARRRFLGTDGLVKALRSRLGLAEEQTYKDLLAEACNDPALDSADLRAVAQAMQRSGGKTDATAGKAIADWVETLEGRPDRWETYLSAFFKQDGEPRTRLVTKATLKVMPGAEVVLAAEAERLTALRERLKAATVAEASEALLQLTGTIFDAYEAAKRQKARLDYEDLIQTSRALLEQPAIAPWVLYKLDGGLDHLLIDEAQDTNPDQWRVVELLTEEFFAGLGADPPAQDQPARSVFAVGDPKQSIYSFQGANPAEFLRMRGHFAQRVRQAERGWQPVDLVHSFRSVAPVLDAVDALFAETAQRDGVTFGEPWRNHDPVRVGQAGCVELWPPVSPEDRADPEVWSPPTERSAETSPRARLAELLAETIRRWTQAETVQPGDDAWLASRDRQIKPGDILVLVRRRNAFVEELIRALKQRAVPVAGIDRMVLTEQLAVMDLVALARACLLPEDDLTLACVLKGPLVGLSEEQLYHLAWNREHRLWQSLERHARQDPVYRAALNFLRVQRGRADLVPPYEFFAELLGAEEARSRLLERLGPDAADPIEEFLGLALSYEAEHTPSLEGFLHWMEIGAQEIKRDAEVAGASVRVMTVHGAKGLQAPVVFLPDSMQTPHHSDRVVWLNGDDGSIPAWAPRRSVEDSVTAAARRRLEIAGQDEYKRLLYVALTRAEDRLYVCGYETRTHTPEDCWYKLCEKAWTATAERIAFDFTETTASGWSGPGLRIAAAQTAMPAPEVPLLAPPDRIPPDWILPAWASRRPLAEPSPPRPLTPSRPSAEEPALRSPLSDDGGQRFARGRAIHRLLQSLPDLPPEARAEAAKRYLSAQALSFAGEGIEALTAEVLAVLDHPDFAALFAPDSVAEAPIVGLIEGADGPEAVSGQVDRLCILPDKVLVVDFKTNRPAPESLVDVAPIYLRQMALYRAILARLYPDRPVETALLWTDGPRLMPLPETSLAAYAPLATPASS
ncbi:double-strand break repair helicase AddA [Algihabitans albus]|uniref:double-strand break repair helicase AddA n=1 Tax=Algihabitans albus TaxID=2164067 RepID=UPI000E5D3B56|nr:double-strand break repair helicase AddA [Algihabitans albus]